MALSPLIHFGISIWTYEGRQGQVYKRQYTKSTFARECMGEYCQYQFQGEPQGKRRADSEMRVTQ